MHPSLRTRVVAVLTLVVGAGCADSTTAPAAPELESARLQPTALETEGRYLVRLAAGQGLATQDAAALAAVETTLAVAGGAVVNDLRAIGYLVVDGLSSDGAQQLAATAGVVKVAPDFRARWIPPRSTSMVSRVRIPASAVSARGTDQTGAFFFADQWNMRQIRVPEAYAATPTGAGAVVCVLDSGVDPGQLDLVGRVDPARRASFVATEPFIEDLNFHGTFVSALIASNGIGMASIAPDATLCAVKVLDLTGNGPVSGVLSGLVYAADVGADVANMSLGIYVPRSLPGVDVVIDAFTAAVAYARERGTQVVAAAGNDGVDLDEDGDMISIPAEIRGVISVAATAPFNQQNFDMLASYTNSGGARGGVDLAAPGGDLLTGGAIEDLILSACSRFVCGGDGIYVFASGTSAAAPHVAAVGAIAESSLAGNQGAGLLDECVLHNVEKIFKPNGKPDRHYGAGRLDALAGGMCVKH